jgi:hypothetical protein
MNTSSLFKSDSIYFDRVKFFNSFDQLKKEFLEIKPTNSITEFKGSPLLDTSFYRFINKYVLRYANVDFQIDTSYYKIFAMYKFNLDNDNTAFIIASPGEYGQSMITIFSINNHNMVTATFELAYDVGDAGFCHYSKSLISKNKSSMNYNLIRIIHETDYSYMVSEAPPKDEIFKGTLTDSVLYYSCNNGKFNLMKYIASSDSIKTLDNGRHSIITKELKRDSLAPENLKNLYLGKYIITLE